MYCFFEIDDVFFWSWLLPKANCPSDQVIKFVESQPASSWNPLLAGFQTLLPRECHLHWRIAHAQKCKLKFFLSQSKVFRPQENFQDSLCYPLTPQNWLADLKFEGFKEISSHNNCTFVRYVRGINCKKKCLLFCKKIWCWADGWRLFLGAVQPDAIFIRFLARLMPFWGGPAILWHISIPIASWL